MSDRYRVLVADPPWLMRDSLPGNGRGASKHYQCLDMTALCNFPLPPLEHDSVLFLWRLASMPREACELAAAWGFTPKSEIVWYKRTKNGLPHFGMGRTVRMAHEVCMIATRGRPKVRHRSQRSVFEAQVGRHSQKPEAFFDLVERMYHGPYVEMFARRQRPGWTCLGNEVSG